MDFLDLIVRTLLRLIAVPAGFVDDFLARPRHLTAAVVVATLAAVSTLLGHVVVLVLNRVRGWRFVASLLGGALLLVGLFALNAAVVSVVGHVASGPGRPFRDVFATLLLSTAPFILGFLAFVPYLGRGWMRVLFLGWALVMLALVRQFYDTSWPMALAITLAGWAVTIAVFRLGGARLAAALVKLFAGRSLVVDADDVFAGLPVLVERR